MNTPARNHIGLSMFTIILLALLGVPRVIAHDLQWVDPHGFINPLLVFIPPIIWILYVLGKRHSVKHPFVPLMVIGAVYGLLLGITHQLLWNMAFETPPALGGNLADLPAAANSFLTRAFAFISSMVTGTVVGIVSGMVATVLHPLVKGRSRR
ncbi:hypothetical protein P4H67_13455 [Paenibacillus lautus]|uniref:hypothetical protein n=1 Tax=Paenibacillus lautus TaxID=1401 RepID=UPI002565C666|nr:hypothetical protein [Paenibacillus lautus]MDL1160096.1 hypothetical protein [Yersinia pestis]MEC0307753.1 hypothetical protein [Paenibacillus lautus]